MGLGILSLLLGGDAKSLLKSLATKEGAWDYTTGRIEGFSEWTESQKAAGRAVFNEMYAMLGLRKILKR